MGFLDKLIDRFKRENSKSNTAAAGYNPRAGAVSLLPQYGAAPLNIAAVYRCVEILSNSVANFLKSVTAYLGQIQTRACIIC